MTVPATNRLAYELPEQLGQARERVVQLEAERKGIHAAPAAREELLAQLRCALEHERAGGQALRWIVIRQPRPSSTRAGARDRREQAAEGACVTRTGCKAYVAWRALAGGV